MVSLANQSALAGCNPKEIKEVDNKYLYPVDCHIEFGELRQDIKLREKQVKHLNKSLELKDLALQKSTQRIENWQQATYKVEDRLIKLDRNTDRLKWIYFGLGIVVMGGAVYAAGQLR